MDYYFCQLTDCRQLFMTNLVVIDVRHYLYHTQVSHDHMITLLCATAGGSNIGQFNILWHKISSK